MYLALHVNEIINRRIYGNAVENSWAPDMYRWGEKNAATAHLSSVQNSVIHTCHQTQKNTNIRCEIIV